MNLYQIDNEILDLLETEPVDPETGEILNVENYELLLSLIGDRDKKIENVACFIKNLDAEVLAIKAEEDQLAKRRKAKENKAAGLREYLSGVLLMDNQRKFESPRCRVSFRETKFADIPDEHKISKKYFIKKTEERLDKRSILEALKEGKRIRGAELKTRQAIQIK